MSGGPLESHIRELSKEVCYGRDKPWPIICRVPNDMHNNRVVDDPQAYKPELVSIGPFHYQNESLLPMLQHKLRLYIRLSERLYGSPAIENDLKKTVDALVQRARLCYSESFHTIPDSDFSWMLTLDTCFILEVFRYYHLKSKSTNKGIVEDDPIFNARRMLPALRLDLIKIENQLPFFLLEELYAVIRTIDQEEPPSLTDYAWKFFAPLVLHEMLEKDLGSSSRENPNRTPRRRGDGGFRRDSHSGDERSRHSGVERFLRDHPHLLALFHSMFKRSDADSSPISTSLSIRESNQLMDMSELRCASYLSKCGIDFSKGNGCLLDIHYRVKSRQLEIPCLVINHSTISVFRNLLAYEQLCDQREPSYFTPYIMFLAQLVKTQKDVEMLCNRGIMNHTLVSDDKVVMEIGNLSKEAAFAYDPLECYLRMPIEYMITLQKVYRKRWMIQVISEIYLSPPGKIMFALLGFYMSAIQTLITARQTK